MSDKRKMKFRQAYGFFECFHCCDTVLEGSKCGQSGQCFFCVECAEDLIDEGIYERAES